MEVPSNPTKAELDVYAWVSEGNEDGVALGRKSQVVGVVGVGSDSRQESAEGEQNRGGY